MKSLMNYIGRVSMAMLLAVTTITAGLTLPAQAAVQSPAAAKVTFSFDDGRQSQSTVAAGVLAKYGLSGTAYITTGCVGMTTTPNTCHAATDVKYMTWDQIKALQNTYGWEIGSHTVSHPYLASTNASDGQPNLLTPDQVTYEIAQSKAALSAQGIDARVFASPYGDYDNFVLQTIAKYYSSHRGFADQNDNVWPYNDIVLNNMQVQGPVTLDAVKSKIDYAITNKQWLILSFHDIVANASNNNNKYQWSTSNLDAIAAYVKSKQTAGLITPTNASGGLATTTTNLLANGSFNSGISSGWTTDNTAAFAMDSASNGSYPDATNSIRVTSSANNAHLFSPRVTVDSNTMYVLKTFLNVQAISKGEIGFYIDEYDSNGNWISGQWKAYENSVYVESMNFTYVPSSIRVKTASLQIYTTVNSGITAYLDNAQWFVANSGTPTQTDLMINGNFDQGLSAGWTTDDTTNIKADAGNHGSPANSVNSIAISKTNGTSHIFAPQIAVNPTKSYYLENYFNITANNGSEVGLYIDEYDSAGNWISGQYKATITALGGKDTSFTYTPSSSNVAKASLQVILTAGNQLNVYFDNSRWWAL